MKIGFLLGLVLIFNACSNNDEVALRAVSESFQSDPIINYSSELCTLFTRIKPEVDFLFVWDNSSSSLFINDETLGALQNTINLVSERFDYRIVLAPLLVSDQNVLGSHVYVMAENPQGINTSQINLIPSDPSSRSQAFQNLPQGVGGSLEKGFERTTQLLNFSRSQNVFRQNAYSVVVLLSNGDDNEYLEGNPTGIRDPNNPQALALDQQYFDQFMSFKSSNNLLQFRFFSLVAHNSCQLGFIPGTRYRRMSQRIYLADNNLNDQASRPGTEDSYDICTTAFSFLFDGINNSIVSPVLPHSYNFWPVAADNSVPFNTDAITVRKNGQGIARCPGNNSCADGFRYAGVQSVNTRFSPTPGEPFSGHVVQLFGSARPTYPDCMIVETSSPVEYYGFLVLARQPDLNTLNITINDRPFGQSTSNGWESLGFRESQNIRVAGPTPPLSNQAGSPEELRTGWVIRLHGEAIYSNNSRIQVSYRPAVNN